jgi:hypothetical protein
MLYMVRILVALFWGCFTYAIGYSGNFRLPIRRGSPLHVVLGRNNLALHGLTVLIALVLPFVTLFAGASMLAFLAASLVVTSLFLYPLQPLGLHVRFVHAGGRRSKPLAEQEKTRWPYAWTCGIGYVVMLIYIWTIAPLFL